MKNVRLLLALLPVITGCVHIPPGPSVAVMPGAGKPFELFVHEDQGCQEFARYQAGGTTQKAVEDSMVESTVAGTIIGAAAGTAIGAIAGDPGAGAIIGAGAGLLEGTAIGASAGYHSSWATQRRYDIAYQQCMYAKGNQIPGATLAYAPAMYPPPPAPPLAQPNNSKPPKY